MAEVITEDLRTDVEKRQDAFDGFLKEAQVGALAKIVFCGDRFKVKLLSRNLDSEVKTVSFAIIGNRHSYEGKNLVFNLDVPDDSELIKIL